jgi:hypothetical protein
MGTSAQLVIQTRPGHHFTFRIGMNSDGSEYNLLVVAENCMAVAKRFDCLTKFKQSHPATVKRVLQAVADAEPDWLFTVKQGNPFIRHTGVFDPLTSQMEHYSGDLGEFIRAEKV